MNLRIISAGAGSGKTYRLTQELTQLLESGVRPSGVIATTFTNKAAAELQERVRVKLLEKGMPDAADELSNALIGTVHSMGVKLLQRFAFEAGVSPEVAIIVEEDQQDLFNRSLTTVLTQEKTLAMEALSEKLGLAKDNKGDWRSTLKELTELARSHDFSIAVLRQSKERSFQEFQALIGPPAAQHGQEQQLITLAQQAIAAIEQGPDETKATQQAVQTLKGLIRQLEVQGYLLWHEWAKIAKLKPGAKSKEALEEVTAFAEKHYEHPAFHEDIQQFIEQLFELGIAAIEEYARYKKQRGLIDYTDMETLVNRLLGHPKVREVLQAEIDLLMVDEFQDTSPIQLEIFLKLSRIAKHSIWVGDPKQSIYGFRGADPELMQAIIQAQGGIRPADIQSYSWRSRALIVHTTNAIFTKAFDNLPASQVALKPKRCKDGSGQSDCLNKGPEPEALSHPIIHWHFEHDGGKRPPGKPWMEDCLADTLKRWLERTPHIQPKGGQGTRPARPGDVAILCKSNYNCEAVASALHRAGLKAAISRTGLLKTAEARYILACLRYLISPYDALSVAETMVLSGSHRIEEVLSERLAFLEQEDGKIWSPDAAVTRQLNALRGQTGELSSAETLDLLLEELQLRREISRWGSPRQRLANVDALRQYALQYESGCDRMHTAASTGGFLIWLAALAQNGQDKQGSGEGPDAVNVLTYHKSKGLEWPVVICHDLENKLRADAWGFDILSDDEAINLGHILSNRWLRYWPNPYADQYRKTFWHEQLLAHPASERAKTKALAEEARVMYVGITRARDYLIFPTRQAPAKWLNRVWHKGQEDYPVLEPHTEETPWMWEKTYINKETEVFPYPRSFTHAETEAAQASAYLSPPAGKMEAPLPFAWGLQDRVPGAGLKIGSHTRYAPPLAVAEGDDRRAAGLVMQRLLLASSPAYSTEEQLLMVKGLQSRFEAEQTGGTTFLRQAAAWQQQEQHRFNGWQAQRFYPICFDFKGRQFKTEWDAVYQSQEEAVIVKHLQADLPADASLNNQLLRQEGAWCALSLIYAQQLFQGCRTKVWLHLPLQGYFVELTA